MNVAEQTELYSEYIEQVRKHNEANDTYSSELKQLADERSSAIEAAITQHMTGLLNFLNILRGGGIVGLVGAGFVFLITLIYSANQSNQDFLGTISVGFIIFVSFVVGIVCLVVVAWTSLRVSDLQDRVNRARASAQT